MSSNGEQSRSRSRSRSRSPPPRRDTSLSRRRNRRRNPPSRRDTSLSRRRDWSRSPPSRRDTSLSRSPTRSRTRTRSSTWGRRRRSRSRRPFEALRNEISSGKTSFIDFRIKEGTVIVPENSDTENTQDTHSDFRGRRARTVRPGSHEPGVARIFLCPRDDHFDAVEDYLEYGESGVPEDVEPRNARKWYKNLDRASNNCAYDLRDLAQWLGGRDRDLDSVVDGESEEEEPNGWRGVRLDEYDAIFTFTELFFVKGRRGGEDAYGNLVQHKLYLFEQDEERLTIVWRCCNEFGFETSGCQEAFLDDIMEHGRYFRKPLPNCDLNRDSFIALFFFEILALDMDELERAVQYEIKPRLSTDLMKNTDAVSTNYFKAMESRIYSFNRMKCMVEKAEDVRETWAYLDKSLRADGANPWAKYLDKQIHAESLRSFALVKHSKRLDQRYQDLFALNTTVSQSRQSLATTILTVLAAVFLPLSLASAVLSMQFRLHELGPRLYDFFGVAWLFCTFALICFVLVRYANKLLDRYWTLKHLERDEYTTWKGPVQGVTYSYIIGWTFVLVSFLLGMFLNYDNIDWRAYPFLAVGIAFFVLSPFVVPVLHILIIVLRLFGACCSCGLMLRKERKEREKRDAAERV